MTVYANNEAVELLGGHDEEAWGIVQFDGGEIRDIHLGMLSANDPKGELLGPIRELNDAGEVYDGVGFDDHLPLRFRNPRKHVSIVTASGKVLFDDEFEPHRYDEMYDLAEDLEHALSEIGTAWKQPRRLCYQRLDHPHSLAPEE